MAFGNGLIFVVGYDDNAAAADNAGTTHVLFSQSNGSDLTNYTANESNVSSWQVRSGATLVRYDGGTATIGTALNGLLEVTMGALSGSDRNGTLRFRVDLWEALANASFKGRIARAFIGGGQINATIDTFDDSAVPILLRSDAVVIELRALKSAAFRLDANVAVRAQHIAPAVANLAFAPGETAADFGCHLSQTFDPATYLPTGSYTTDAPPDANGDLTIPVAYHAPPDAASRNMRLRVQRNLPSPIGDQTKTCLIPVDIHVPTDIIVSFDRSGSMQAFIDGSATLRKWNAAESVGNLFSTLFGTLLPSLSTPNGAIADANRTLLTKWFSSGGTTLQYEDVSGDLMPSSAPPQFLPASASGGTPIGDALLDAVAKFNDQGSNTKWKRRHLILLTDGMHNSGTELITVTLPLPAADGSDTDGIVLHTVKYAVGTEAFNPHLDALNAASGGQNHDSSADTDPLNADGLLEMYLNVLHSVLPVDVALMAAPTTIPVEDGIERAVFVATAEGATPLHLSLGAENTGGGGAANGLTWVVADSPSPGAWTLNTTPGGSLLTLYDLALRFTFGAEPAGIGQPIKLWAELRFRGEPVSGADIRVGSRRPGESVGELLTKFVQSGGLLTAVRRGLLKDIPLNGAIDVTASPGAVAQADVPSTQSQLLRLAEHWRNLPLQYLGDSILMTEVAKGRYEATVPAGATENEYVRNFYFRADGMTPGGHAFARNGRTSVMLDPVPDPEQSDTTLAVTSTVGNVVTWTATAFPRTAAGKPAGPGLGHYFYFQYLDPKDVKARPALRTIDKLDGTYAVDMPLKDRERPPAIGLFARTRREWAKGAVVSIKPDEPVCGRVFKVKVALHRIQVLDDKDGILSGKGELAFDAVVAPNGNPRRAVRTRIPENGVLQLASGQSIEFSDVLLYEGLVEQGASLAITMGGTEFDYLLFFKRKEKLARYHRQTELKAGTLKFGPGDERDDPESLRDWRVWYSVVVE